MVIPHIPSWVTRHPFWILLILLLPVCACISITIAPSRMADDGSARYASVKNGVLHQSEDLAILEIGAEELVDMTQQGEGMLYIWAPWCAPCMGTLKYHFKKEFETEGKLVLVSSNYDIPNIVKFLGSQIDTAYVLSAITYGRNETDKLKGISGMLIGQELNYVPQMYLFDHGAISLSEKRN